MSLTGTSFSLKENGVPSLPTVHQAGAHPCHPVSQPESGTPEPISEPFTPVVSNLSSAENLNFGQAFSTRVRSTLCHGLDSRPAEQILWFRASADVQDQAQCFVHYRMYSDRQNLALVVQRRRRMLSGRTKVAPETCALLKRVSDAQPGLYQCQGASRSRFCHGRSKLLPANTVLQRLLEHVLSAMGVNRCYHRTSRDATSN